MRRPARCSSVKGDEPDPISITLQPAGTVTGRLVDEEGRPRPNVPFVVMQDLKTTRFERFSVQPPTGPDGRFRISGLVPGVSYNVETIRRAPRSPRTCAERCQGSIGKPGWTVKPGETQDWGDVRVKRFCALTVLDLLISANRLLARSHLFPFSIENRESLFAGEALYHGGRSETLYWKGLPDGAA